MLLDGASFRLSTQALPVDSPARVAARRVAAIVTCFLLLSLPFARQGQPRSPALAALAALPSPLAFAVVGDSRAHVGVSPGLLSRAFADAGLGELRGHNFAVDGSDVLHHRSFLATGLLEEPRAPRLVIWSPSPLSFDATRTENRLDHLRARDLPALIRAGAPTEMILDLATMAALPAYRGRPQAKATIDEVFDLAGARLTLLQARIVDVDFKRRPKEREYLSHPDGYQPFQVIDDWEGRFARGARAYSARYEKLALGALHFELARDLARRVRESGALLVIVELPVAPFLQRAYARLPKHRAWQAEIQRIAAEEGAIWISDVDRYDADRLFGDPAHMHVETAERYSKALADELLREPRVRAALLRAEPGEAR